MFAFVWVSILVLDVLHGYVMGFLQDAAFFYVLLLVFLAMWFPCFMCLIFFFWKGVDGVGEMKTVCRMVDRSR